MSSLSQDNNKLNSVDVSNNIKDKESNIIKSIKDKYIISKEHHPLEFYALGKINNNMYNVSSTFYNSPSLSSPRLRANNSSHNLFDRNLLSVNNSFFDNLKRVKNTASLTQLNRNENDYLNPLLIYKLRKENNKESQKRNNINSLEWLNLIKNKLFAVDINSKIKNGTNVSRNYFYELKNKNIISPKNILDNNNNNHSYENDNKNNSSYQLEKIKNSLNNFEEGYDYKYNTNRTIEKIFNCKRFKKDNEKLNKINILKPHKYSDYWKKLRIEKSYSTEALNNKNVKKHDEKVLKANFLYFDKNYKNILRHRNWWLIDQ